MAKANPNRAGRSTSGRTDPSGRTDRRDHDAAPGVAGVQGIFSGLSGLLKTLSDLAEKGKELHEAGLGDASRSVQGERDGVRFHYGFNIRTMNDGGVRVEPFGNLRTDKATGEAHVDEVREPMADVFEEDDRVTVVLEMPGVGPEDVKLDVQGDVMAISASRGNKRYRKEVLLPAALDRAKMTVTCNNGVVEIRCPR